MAKERSLDRALVKRLRAAVGDTSREIDPKEHAERVAREVQRARSKGSPLT